MADYISSMRADENEAELQLRNMKKILTTATYQATKENKRAALGELGNRVHRVAVEKKEKDFKNVKPRVDTHWKKGAAATGPVGKVMTRSESMKVLLPAPTALAAPAAVRAVAKPVTSKTTINNTVKLIKNRISKTTTNSNASTTTLTITSIKREDSKLTRRSLSKLKAAFMRDASPEKVKVKNEATSVFSPETHSSKLLEQIENIDSKDDLNPLLMSEYVNEIYEYLNKLEEELPVSKDHLNGQAEITPKMRSVLVDWINEVHYQFKLEIETYHMTVSIIDRYLQEVKNVPRRQLQLVGVAALFIASKYEELYPPEINDYVFIADDAYTKQQILEMEKQIVRALDFQLGKPLPIHFLRRYSKAAKAETEHHLMSKYLIELSSVEYTMAHYRPSEIAAAALYLSLKVLSKAHAAQMPKWTLTLQHYSAYKTQELKPVVEKLAKLAKNASAAKQMAVYNKYATSKFDRISTRAEINTGTVIEQIVREAVASS